MAGVPGAGPFESEKATWYSATDRNEQLRRLASACHELAVLYEGRDGGLSAAYASINRRAEELRFEQPQQARLDELATALPERPAWLHRKFADYQVPREPWQDEVARLRVDVERAAVELRSLATYEGA